MTSKEGQWKQNQTFWLLPRDLRWSGAADQHHELITSSRLIGPEWSAVCRHNAKRETHKLWLRGVLLHNHLEKVMKPNSFLFTREEHSGQLSVSSRANLPTTLIKTPTNVGPSQHLRPHWGCQNPTRELDWGSQTLQTNRKTSAATFSGQVRPGWRCLAWMVDL